MRRCSDCGWEYDPATEKACPKCAGEWWVIHCRRCDEAYTGSDACPICGLAAGDFRCDRHSGETASGRCVLCGRAVCGVCRADEGRVHLCAEHEGVRIIQGWAQVYSTGSEFKAQLLRENLAAEGIEARIYSQRDAMFSVDLGDLSIVRILVPAWEYVRARQTIQDHMDPEGEVSFGPEWRALDPPANRLNES